MATHWEVRQLVRTAIGNRLEVIARPPYERVAEAAFRQFCIENPQEYFELVRVEHSEECLQHNGKPDVSPGCS